MINEYSDDRRGWAQFSDDRVMRFRLARSLMPKPLMVEGQPDHCHVTVLGGPLVARVVFLMLNPSTADAFKLDPTVSKCCQFAQRWGADILEVVNLFALRSPHPDDLKKRAFGSRGDDHVNGRAILDAVMGAWKVIAAWGNHGALDHRDIAVRDLLSANGVTLWHLGLTQEGRPLHPLARGKNFIPLDREPVIWGAS